MFVVAGQEVVADLHPQWIADNLFGKCLRLAHHTICPACLGREEVSCRHDQQRDRPETYSLAADSPFHGLSFSSQGRTSCSICLTCSGLNSPRMNTPPETLRALTMSSFVAVELWNSGTSGTGERELFKAIAESLGVSVTEVAVVVVDTVEKMSKRDWNTRDSCDHT